MRAINIKPKQTDKHKILFLRVRQQATGSLGRAGLQGY